MRNCSAPFQCINLFLKKSFREATINSISGYVFGVNYIPVSLERGLVRQLTRGEVYNVAVGDHTTLNELFLALRNTLKEQGGL